MSRLFSLRACMRAGLCGSLIAAVALVSPTDMPAAAEASPEVDPGELTTRVYRPRFLDYWLAVTVAHETCLAELPPPACTFETRLHPHGFLYTTRDSMQEKIAAMLAATDVPDPSLELRVVLLLAGPEAAAQPDLPQAEARALADVQQILPYKGYQLLESGLVRTRDRANLRLGHDPAYEAQIELERPADPRQDTIQVRRFNLMRHGVRQVRRESAPDGGVPGVEWERHSEEIMATRFAMEAGETVVVGTSKLNGDDRALIVLLTAGR